MLHTVGNTYPLTREVWKHYKKGSFNIPNILLDTQTKYMAISKSDLLPFAMRGKLIIDYKLPSLRNKFFWSVFDRYGDLIHYSAQNKATLISHESFTAGATDSDFEVFPIKITFFESIEQIHEFIDCCINTIGEFYIVDLYKSGLHFTMSFYLTDDISKIREKKIKLIYNAY